MITPSEKILSFVLCPFAELNGMMGTMVIASEACETGTIMLPDWCISQSTFNVIHGTYVFANTTFHTCISFDMKRTIGDEVSDKVCAKYIAVDTRPTSDSQTFNAFFACNDAGSIAL